MLRVLRPGGCHVFTVPFLQDSPLDHVRSRLGADGTTEHLMPPQFHDDPLRGDGMALVFTVFGLEMIPNLARIGFDVTVYRPWDPARGLVEPGGLVFEARRRPDDPPPPPAGAAGSAAGREASAAAAGAPN